MLNNPNGGRDFHLNGGDDWSDDDFISKSYREKGEDYKITAKIQEMLNRDPSRLKEEHWVGVDYDNKRHKFPSYEALQRRIRKGDIVFRSVSKLAQENAVAQSLKACVLIESIAPSGTSKEIGAGFAIGNGFFITCAHVIQRYDKNKMPAQIVGKQITLHQQGESAQATLVAASPALDLAVVKSSFPTTTLSLGRSRDIPISSEVFTIGSPNGFENNFTEGVFSSRDRRVFFYEGAPLFIFTDAQVLPGSSGGPLISAEDNSVIGMIALIVGGQGLYGLNAALPSEYIIDFLKQHRIA